MFNKLARGAPLVGTLAWFLVACGAGSSADPGELNGVRAQAYAFSCDKSSCDRCHDEASDLYSECLRLCAQPFAPADCFSTCGSVGDSSCGYSCGDNERCEEWTAELPLPERDEDFFAACSDWLRTCVEIDDEDYIYAACDEAARLAQPKFGKEYRCALSHACDPDGAAHCLTSPEPGTIGSELCARANACGQPCRPGDASHSSDEAYINSFQPKLRPSLVDIARQCVAEAECGKFLGCKAALDHLWWLDADTYQQRSAD